MKKILREDAIKRLVDNDLNSQNVKDRLEDILINGLAVSSYSDRTNEILAKNIFGKFGEDVYVADEEAREMTRMEIEDAILTYNMNLLSPETCKELFREVYSEGFKETSLIDYSDKELVETFIRIFKTKTKIKMVEKSND
jgi:NAD-specific glutamate dehydrogenase